jgi:hypothetical protein
VADQHQQPEKPASTSSFKVLHAASNPKAPARKAPNPLRNASPERLAAANAEVERIIAARRHGLASP